MKYRHAFHAGNFADVHKHVLLLALLRTMQRKDKGFLYVDTHAGRGSYELSGPDTRPGGEAAHGYGLIARATPESAELRDYLQQISAWRAFPAHAHSYPGSPLLATAILRPQDRAVCYELQPAECRALQHSLIGVARVQIECAEGLQRISALLPPLERRALLLIDPPYEVGDAEFNSVLAGMQAALQRLANVVLALWYPIKDDRELQRWLQRAASLVRAPLLCSELWLHPRDSRVALNGSGILIVNPPYQCEQRMRHWLPELGRLLDRARTGGTAVRWLAHEPVS
jgi:23S rRNA (adenine2030-N6)-methyltransferase